MKLALELPELVKNSPSFICQERGSFTCLLADAPKRPEDETVARSNEANAFIIEYYLILNIEI